MNPTRNDIDLIVRKGMAILCNSVLADVINLKLQTKQAHWNVKGSNFIGVHTMLDELSSGLEGFADTIAERAVQIGGTALGTIEEVTKGTKISSYPVNITSSKDHLLELSKRYADVGKSVRKAIMSSQNEDDMDTSDIFIETSRGIDKYLWFIESHLQE